MKKLLLFSILAVFPFLASGQAAKNMVLRDHLAYPGMNLAGCWGYTTAGGTEYALVGAQTGVSIVDVTNPDSVFEVQFLPGIWSGWREIKTWDHYAYVTNESGDGLRIIDLSTLPGPVAYRDTVMDSIFTAHTLWIDENGVLFINGGYFHMQGTELYDLTADPWNPVNLGGWHDRYIHDLYTRNDTAYVASIGDGLFEIIDFSDPSSPVVLSSTTYPNAFTHNTWLNDAGTACFTTDELDSAWIYSWDVTDPASPVLLDGIRSSLSGGMATPHNVQVVNDFIVTSYYKDGVHVTDAARPHNLIEVGYYDCNPDSGGLFPGVWGAYPLFPSGTVIGSDMLEGLFVLTPDYKRGCYLEGIVTDSVTGLPISGVDVNMISPTVYEATNGTGFYAMGVADSGTYTVTYHYPGYEFATVTWDLDHGVLINGDVKLKPMNLVDLKILVVESGTLTPIENAEVTFTDSFSGDVFTWMTNASGEVLDSGFFSSMYQANAGHWGHLNAIQIIDLSTAVMPVTIELDKGYSDDFFKDYGWQSKSAATAGQWVRAEPIGTIQGVSYQVNPEEDISGDYGDLCYVTGNGGGLAFQDDVDGGSVYLFSPMMDLRSYGKPMLKFYRWFANTGGVGAPNDTLYVHLTNGIDTVLVTKFFGTAENHWKLDSFDLTGLVAKTDQMQIIFTAWEFPGDNITDAGIDGFSIHDAGPIGIDDAAGAAASLHIFPNPSEGWATADFEILSAAFQDPEIHITDLSGKVLWQQSAGTSAGRVLLPQSLPAGMYLVSLVADGSVLRTTRLVKQ